MKTAEEILKEGNEGYPLRDVIDNLSDEQILGCIYEYAEKAIKEVLERAAGNAKLDYYNNEVDKFIELKSCTLACGDAFTISKSSILNTEYKDLLK